MSTPHIHIHTSACIHLEYTCNERLSGGGIILLRLLPYSPKHFVVAAFCMLYTCTLIHEPMSNNVMDDQINLIAPSSLTFILSQSFSASLSCLCHCRVILSTALQCTFWVVSSFWFNLWIVSRLVWK